MIIRKPTADRRPPGLLGAALFAGAASLALAGPALATEAAEAGDADAGVEVSGVEVHGKAAETGVALIPTSIQDTPQTLQVVGQQQLKQQGVTSLEQALRNVPGITIAIGEGGTLNGDQFKIRGFDAKDDVYVDGLRDFGVYARDSFAYEEVQVLKGPSGAMFGRGTTGGAINTVTKTPKLDDFGDLDLYAGNARYGRALLDVNRQLTQTSAFRLNLMAQTSHGVERDVIRGKRWGVDLAYAYGLGTRTTLKANYLHQSEDKIPDYGIIIVQPPGSLIAMPASEYNVGVPRNTFTGWAADRDHTRADVFTVRLNHQATPWLTLTSDSRLGVYSRYFQYSTTDSCSAVCTANLFDGNPATAPNAGVGGSGPYTMDAWGAQNISTARAEFQAGGLKNQLILGLDLSYQANDKSFKAYTLPAGITARNLIPRDLTNPDRDFPAGYALYTPSASNICPVAPARACSATAATVLSTSGKSSNVGLILTDRLWFTPELSVIGSARFDAYSATLDSLTVGGAFTRLKSNSRLISPRVSLVWEPAKSQTLYLSWGRSSTPQGTSIVGAGTALAVTTRDLEPEVSESWEAGAKTALLDGRLLVGGAIFDVKKNNATQADPATGFTLAQSGERQEVKGVELTLTGKISDAWTLNAAYSYLDAKILESYTACTPTTLQCPVGAPASTPVLNPFVIGRQVTFVPKNSASLWTTYDLKDLVPGLSAGGGVTYQDKLYLGYTTATVAPNPTGLSKIAMVPENISIDGYLAYEVGHVRIAVNGYNLTDRLNYSQVFGNRAVPTGRSIIVSLGVRF
jgi:catecholate siderophore receptor